MPFGKDETADVLDPDSQSTRTVAVYRTEIADDCGFTVPEHRPGGKSIELHDALPAPFSARVPIPTSFARVSATLVLALTSWIACDDGHRAAIDEAPNAQQPVGAETSRRPEFCARAGADAVRDVFCVESPPEIESLAGLFRLLGLTPESGERTLADERYYLLSNVAVLAHSTALSGGLVSSINPRVIVMGPYTFAAFQRGVQRVELASRTRGTDDFNFYLIEFEQACNDSKAGCSVGDLFTPAIEFDWRKVRLRDEAELKNTPLDCRQCHRRSGEEAGLLMRELESPWTHFFLPPGPGLTPGVTGSDLLADFTRAKGDELYAGFALNTITDMTPFFLEGAAGPEQPLLFDAPTIEQERHPYGPDGYAKEPHPSPTWERAYEAFKRGEQLALPYHEPRATDPEKLAALTGAYQRYRAGELDANELPDLADIFPDDARERARRGLQTEPDASPADILIQACGSCHNDALDQTISRARFNIRVGSHDRRELDAAIERIRREPGAPGAMPPDEARQLDPEARERLIDYLKGDPRTLEREDRLDRASQSGMLGGGGRRRAFGNL